MSFEMRFTAIRPKMWTLKYVRLELMNTLRKEARAGRKEYQQTTRTWAHKPVFKISGLSLRGQVARITVSTTDRIYGYVDRGTRRHVIEPRSPVSISGRPSSLRFRPGYRRKTRPRHIGSSAGGRFGAYVYPVSVTHPGIKARGFTPLIRRRAQRRLNASAPKAVQRGIEKGIKS